MKKQKELDRLTKELVKQMTGNEVEDPQEGDYQIAYYYLSKAMDYTHSCTELKEKKAIPFDDWTRVKGMKLLIDSNYRWDKTHVYKEVVHKMYEVYLINL